MEKCKVRNFIPVILCIIVIAFVQITICSRSSFLYPFNNWDDANCFLSTAKGMSKGMVLYRDIYEQKGPYLYFLYVIANFISSNSFLGVYLIEIIMASLSLYGFYLTLRLYLEKSTSILILPLVSAIIYSSSAFYWGGSAEELVNPILVYSFYISIKYFKEQYPKNIENRFIIIMGLFAGFIFAYKYTLLGLHFAFMMMIAIAALFRREICKAISQSIIFLISMGVANIPILVYFGYNKALDSYIEGYFAMNLKNYSDIKSQIGIKLTIVKYWETFLDIGRSNVLLFSLITIGIISILVSRKFKLIEKICVLMMSLFMFVFIYMGSSSFPYYPFPLTIFVVFGFVILVRGAKCVFNKWRFPDTTYGKCIIAIIIYIVSILVIFVTSLNTSLIGYPREKLYIYEIVEEMEKYTELDEDTTILNYGFLDMGLYTVLDIVPNVRFFQGNNMGLAVLKEEQDRYIREQKCDFIITLYNDAEFEGYTLIKYLMVEDLELLNYPCPYRLYVKDDLLILSEGRCNREELQ